MKPIKIPEFPFRAYYIIPYFSTFRSRIEVYEVEIIGYEELTGWEFKYNDKILWQMEPRYVNDVGTYRSLDFENFCYDLYSVKTKVEALRKELIVKTNNELSINDNEVHSLVRKLTEVDNNSRSLRKNLQTLEEAQFPDIRSLYEKF